jgi:AcrR family transcriptional regulator
MEKARRKEREFIHRRGEILEAAARVFAAKGFHNATVAEIASGSGFAIGTLYQFFASKEQLYGAMLTEKLATMYEGIQKAVAEEAEIMGKIAVLVDSHFRFIEENAEFCNIFVRGDYLSLSEGSTELRLRMRRDYTAYLTFIEGVMGEGIRRGIFKRIDPALMATALTGIVNACASKWLALAGGAALRDQASAAIAIFLEGVRRDED